MYQYNFSRVMTKGTTVRSIKSGKTHVGFGVEPRNRTRITTLRELLHMNRDNLEIQRYGVLQSFSYVVVREHRLHSVVGDRRRLVMSDRRENTVLTRS